MAKSLRESRSLLLLRASVSTFLPRHHFRRSSSLISRFDFFFSPKCCCAASLVLLDLFWPLVSTLRYPGIPTRSFPSVENFQENSRPTQKVEHLHLKYYEPAPYMSSICGKEEDLLFDEDISLKDRSCILKRNLESFSMRSNGREKENRKEKKKTKEKIGKDKFLCTQNSKYASNLPRQDPQTKISIRDAFVDNEFVESGENGNISATGKLPKVKKKKNKHSHVSPSNCSSHEEHSVQPSSHADQNPLMLCALPLTDPLVTTEYGNTMYSSIQDETNVSKMMQKRRKKERKNAISPIDKADNEHGLVHLIDVHQNAGLSCDVDLADQLITKNGDDVVPSSVDAKECVIGKLQSYQRKHQRTKKKENDVVSPSNCTSESKHSLDPLVHVHPIQEKDMAEKAIQTYKKKKKTKKNETKTFSASNCTSHMEIGLNPIMHVDQNAPASVLINDDVVALLIEDKHSTQTMLQTYKKKRKRMKKVVDSEDAFQSELSVSNEKYASEKMSSPRLNMVDSADLVLLSNKHDHSLETSEMDKLNIKTHVVCSTSLNQSSTDLEGDIGEEDSLDDRKTFPSLHSQEMTDDALLDITKEKVSTPQEEKMSIGRLVISTRKKLLVLDLNGLLVDVTYFSGYTDRVHRRVSGKSVFKRPYCDEFLKFCFEAFDIGIWSSRKRYNVDAVVDFIMGYRKHNLLFCWDQSKCTRTGCNTISEKHKPLVLKELRKLWGKNVPFLPWENGKYSPSNTLLIDDSPYKALCNPPNTAIFPFPYHHQNESDNSLGLQGDLRVYLERLVMADDVQVYVQNNPFGQQAITELDTSWPFYLKIIEKVKRKSNPNARD